MDGSTSSFLADTPYFSSLGENAGLGILYIEDFDIPAKPAAAPPPPPEPDIPPPVYSAADLAAAREAGRQEGYASSLKDSLAVQAQLENAALQQLADALAAAHETLNQAALRAASETARSVLAMLTAAIPAAMARHAGIELGAIIATLLPGLACEPELRVRAHPDLADYVRETLVTMLPPELTQLSVAADEALTRGDIRIEWRDGSAVRDCGAIWDSMRAALAPLALPALEEICRAGK